MAKICMISIDHSPLDDRIFYKEALSLKASGHELSMICRGNEKGVLFDMGGTTPLNSENSLSMEFQGIQTYSISSPTGTLTKLSYKFLKGEFFEAFIKKGIEIQADVYHAHEPVSFYIGYQISQRTGAKVVFDSHESLVSGTPKEKWIKRFYYPKLKYLITANQLTRGYMVSKYPQIQSEVIYNAAQKAIFTPEIRTPSRNELIVAHDGYLPFNRGLKEMLDAFKMVHSKHPSVRFKLIGQTTGDEAKYLQNFIQVNSLEKVIFETGWLPYEKVASALSDCSIGIIAKTGTLNNIIGGPPIKYFNYTAAGVAIVDVNMPETTRLLSTYKNGITVNSNSAQHIAFGILDLVENPNLLQEKMNNSIKAFEFLNWEFEAKKLSEFYTNVVLNDEDIIHY
jgi:hypothetical protein